MTKKILFLSFFAASIYILLVAVFYDFPMEKNCAKIEGYISDNNLLPDSLSVLELEGSLNIFSSTEYKVIGEDYAYSYCPTYFGPCLVCARGKEPFFY